MRKKMVLLTVVSLLVLGIAQFASAAGPGFMGGEKWNVNLDLSEEQRAQLLELQKEHFTERQNLRNQIAEKMFELRQLYLQENPDQDKISELKEQLTDLRTKMIEQAEEHRTELKSILTTEQLEKLEAGFGRGFGKGFRRGGFCFGGRGFRF